MLEVGGTLPALVSFDLNIERRMTMHHTQPLGRRATPAVALLCLATLANACSRGNEVQRTSSGSIDTRSIDTSVLREGAFTPAAGPGIHVTRTDEKSVQLATKYKLTNDNFSRFMRAADSLGALESRDSTVRAYVSTNLTDAGAREADAGVKWIQANALANNAIVSSGLSVPDYFVAGIAIASAERYMKDPKAAPPTPTLADNANFLRAHTADLDHLRALREGEPVITVKP